MNIRLSLLYITFPRLQVGSHFIYLMSTYKMTGFNLNMREKEREREMERDRERHRETVREREGERE